MSARPPPDPSKPARQVRPRAEPDEKTARTARAQAELRLEVERSLWAALVAVDRVGRLIYVNRAFCDLLGWSEQELLGRAPPFPFWPEENLADIEQAFRRMLLGEFPREGVELRFCRRDGERIDVLVTGSPLLDREGGRVGWLGLFEDLTENKKAAAERARDEELSYRTLLDNIGDIVARFDRDGRYLYINPVCARYSGLGPEHYIGRTPSERDPGPQARFREEAIRRVYTTGVPEEHEQEFDALGHHYLFLWKLFPERDDHGQIKAVITVSHDMTEGRAAERRLRRYSVRLRGLSRRLVAAQEAERRRVGRDLHDLIGQNLSALGINLEIVRSDLSALASPATAARIASMKTIIEDTVQSVRDVVTELRPHLLEDCGLAVGLEGLARQYRERSQLSVDVAVRGDPVRLNRDVELGLYRIAQESVANAAKHSKAGGVRMDLQYAGERVTLIISDDGRGFRADIERRTDVRGVGLMIMRERAEAIGGAFDVRAIPGEGTRISVTITSNDADPGSAG